MPQEEKTCNVYGKCTKSIQIGGKRVRINYPHFIITKIQIKDIFHLK